MMLTIEKTTRVPVKEESCVVDVDIVILLAWGEAKQDSDMRGHTEKSNVGMVEFEKSFNLRVQLEKLIAMEVHAMEVSTVELVHKDQGKMCGKNDMKLKTNGIHVMREKLLMCSRCSRLVGQVEIHILGVLMIDKSSRLLVQPKLSLLVHKVNEDPDKRKCMEGCFEYQVDPENLYRVKGAQSREERKHRRRRSKQVEMRSKGQVMMRDEEKMKDGNMTREGQPTRYGDAQAMQEGHNQLSPRERKRIKSLAARRVPREEWMIRQGGEWKKYKQATE